MTTDTALVTSCFVTDNPNQLIEIAIGTLNNHNATIRGRFVNKVLFFYNTNDSSIPKRRPLGLTSKIRFKKLILDIIVLVAEEDIPANEGGNLNTGIKIDVFGLDGDFTQKLEKKAKGIGDQIFYRFELNFA